MEFLAIDHIDGGGEKHRRTISDGKRLCGLSFYLWLKRNNWPSGFRVLCHNCNFSFGAYGYCPHVSPSEFNPEKLLRKATINYAVGIRVSSTKINEVQVERLRELRTLGRSVRELKNEFGLSNAQIYKICAGKSRRSS
jgi:hypothetical protein